MEPDCEFRHPALLFGRRAGIYRVDLLTHRVSKVAGSDGLYSPRLSPDGSYISALSTDAKKLVLGNLKKGTWSTLTEGENFGSNNWSHDGKYIYTLNYSLARGAELSRIKIFDRKLEVVFNFKDKNIPASREEWSGWAQGRITRRLPCGTRAHRTFMHSI